jgi:hypothetical protein
MEALISSETSFSMYQTARCNIPENSHLAGEAANTDFAWNVYKM